ncbi:MAG: SDR family NAD(P)-dependent oxidoreductase, partial [Pseudomonadota bacterium]
MNNAKTFIVTGAASGIGAETCRLLKEQGATVIGVDRNETGNADRFYKADLADPASIDALIAELPEGTDGLANIAGVPPTMPAEAVLKVNLYGLQRLTRGLVPKLADGASIANLASLAGFGWPNAVDQVKRTMDLSLEDDVAAFCRAEGLNEAEGGRSYFLSKEALIVWTLQNRWTWRDRDITMNCISPGPVDTPILGAFSQGLKKIAK